MTQLALDIIAENKAKYARGEDASYLYLGRCGLNEIPDLSGMDWVETLILSSEWLEFDVEKKQWIFFESPNSDIPNRLEKIPPSYTESILLRAQIHRAAKNNQQGLDGPEQESAIRQRTIKAVLAWLENE